MEALSQTLQPYKDIVGQVASIVTILQFFSGAVICKDIYKQGNTKKISAMPFIGGIVVGILMMKYSLILKDSSMLQVNQAAIGLNIVYLIVYLFYTDNIWENIVQPCTYGAGLSAVLLGYAQIESAENIEFRYGLIVTIMMLVLMGAPLADLKEIIATRDASSIPYPIVFMGTIVSLLWLVYAIILLNYFMIVQNIIGFLLCLVQLALAVIFSKAETGQASKKKRAKKD